MCVDVGVGVEGVVGVKGEGVRGRDGEQRMSVGECGVEEADVVLNPVAKVPQFAPRPAIREHVATLARIADRNAAGEGDSWEVSTLLTYRPEALRKVAVKLREAARYLGIQDVKVSVYSPEKMGYPFTWQTLPNGSVQFGTWSLWVHFPAGENPDLRT